MKEVDDIKDDEKDLIDLVSFIEKRRMYRNFILCLEIAPSRQRKKLLIEVYEDSGVIFLPEIDFEIEFSKNMFFYHSYKYPQDIISFIYSFLLLNIKIVVSYNKKHPCVWDFYRKEDDNRWAYYYTEKK